MRNPFPRFRVERSLIVVLAALVLLAAGCASQHRTHYIDESADFESIRRVAVLPFENMTRDSQAAEKVRRIFIIELMSLEALAVVDTGEVTRVLREEGVTAVDALGPEDIVNLAQALDSHALVLGSVQSFDKDRTSQVTAPQVALTFRLLDGTTGDTIWTASVSRAGAGAGSHLFGVSSATETEAARKLVREALDTLVE